MTITDVPLTTTRPALVDLIGPMSGHAPGQRTMRPAPAGWETKPYGRITVEPMTPVIGAEISGVSLADPVDDELFEELNRALLEWKVLVFRGQHITADQQRTFAARWGDLEAHPFVKGIVDQPEEIDVISVKHDETTPGFENIWHSDVTWRACPSLGSILRAIELPALGGDTLWADMGAVYDNLTPQMKEFLDGKVALHDWVPIFGWGLDDTTREALRADFPPQEHPVVRTHPETGRKTLYVNRAFTQHIVDMEPTESAELLDFLYSRAAFAEYQCRVRWNVGDVAFWDNRSTCHYAASDYFPVRRVMERITIAGDRPR